MSSRRLKMYRVDLLPLPSDIFSMIPASVITFSNLGVLLAAIFIANSVPVNMGFAKIKSVICCVNRERVFCCIRFSVSSFRSMIACNLRVVLFDCSVMAFRKKIIHPSQSFLLWKYFPGGRSILGGDSPDIR